jgi:hypothetical protein
MTLHQNPLSGGLKSAVEADNMNGTEDGILWEEQHEVSAGLVNSVISL